MICTYNRSALLGDALESVCQQNSEADECEVIVVDNASNDDTRDVVQQCQLRYPDKRIRYVFEAQSGLSYARNRGAEEAKGTYIAYLDDDGKAPSHWLSKAIDIIATIEPDAFGGPFYAFYNTADVPAWFKDEYGSSVITESPRLLDIDEYLTGGNMVISKQSFDRVGSFDPHLGMAGNRVGYGEETEWQVRLRNLLPSSSVYYDPGFYIYHLVRPDKWSWRWIVKAKFEAGRSKYYAGSTARLRSANLWQVFAYSLWRIGNVLMQFIYALIFRDRVRYASWQNCFYERGLKYIGALGSYYERFQSIRLHRR